LVYLLLFQKKDMMEEEKIRILETRKLLLLTCSHCMMPPIACVQLALAVDAYSRDRRIRGKGGNAWQIHD
jgi:hypothetical protein